MVEAEKEFSEAEGKSKASERKRMEELKVRYRDWAIVEVCYSIYFRV